MSIRHRWPTVAELQQHAWRAVVLWLTLAGVVPAEAQTAAAQARRHPNVVVILADDQGWGDLSVNGNRNLQTPNIDSLARDGATFDRFYVCPVCSPTRAEFLTGRYHPRGGVYSTSAGGERLDLDETTIAEVFRAAGYATAAFGKWHNGMQYPYHPNGRGFDEFYGFCSGHWGHYFSPMLEHNGAIVRGNGYLTDDFTNHAMEFIERHRQRPFFVYLAYNTPHSPMQVPDRWWNRFKDKPLVSRHRDPKKENVPHTRAALAMCENIDFNVGRLLRKLDDLGLAEQTIVVYFSDNGPNGNRYNGGMKGRKGSTDEGGVRAPMFIRWKGHIPAGRTVRPIAAAIDLLPTLADLAGIPVHTAKPLDGVSLAPLLLDEPDDWPDRMIFSHWRGRVSVRTQRWRLDHAGHLFDMPADPGQRTPCEKRFPDVAQKLRDAVARWRKVVLAELGRDDRPFPVGHPDVTYTQLPARDAQFSGAIRRSNRFPNCSYLTHWTRTEDRITFDVEVLAPGRFEAIVYYTCPAADVGSLVEVRFGDSATRGRVAPAHDPPLIGAEQDRVPRQESYVKDFRPLSLGTFELPRGRGKLELRALEIPGSQVMDFRLLLLRRLPPSERR
ncbi:MAG: N-acetylgalactosamine 6-sulfate sulfatase [Planctomycetota bacterium]|nr:MAG: N-acetylgalactosamine 6-sulfate sulfatase [Planctomycetota bacterium]